MVINNIYVSIIKKMFFKYLNTLYRFRNFAILKLYLIY